MKDGEIKKSETYTGAITLANRDNTWCHAMVRNNFDFNSYKTIEEARTDMVKYYRMLSEYIREQRIMYLLDIHGAILRTPFSIAVGTARGEFINNEGIWREITEESFKKYGIETNFDTKFQASTPNTISRFINSNNNIKTTQFEIDKGLRSLDNGTQNFENMMNGLKDCTEEINRQIRK